MASLSILKLVAIAVTIVTMVHGSPLSRRDIWTGGSLRTGNNYQCHDVPESISCYCDYNVTVLPNSRGHTTVAQAYAEFIHFKPLLTATPCSDYIGTLLCFEYFPLPVKGDKIGCEDGYSIIQPCRSTCESAKNTACTNYVLSAISSGWAPHLDCRNFPLNNTCAGTDITKEKDFSACLAASKPTEAEVPTTDKPTEIEVSTTEEATTTEKPTEVEVSTADKSESTEEPSEVFTTEESTEEPSKVSTTEESTEAPTKKVVQCPKKCSIRTNFNTKTFARNEELSFAIRATLVSKATESSYEVIVNKTLPLETCIDGAKAPAVTLASDSTVIVTSCYDLSGSLNSEVLIAGTHTGTQDEGYELSVGCTKSTGLVAPWKDLGPALTTRANISRLKQC